MTYRYSSKERLHIRRLLLQEIVEELHEGLLALEPCEVGEGLQGLRHQRQVTGRTLIRVLCNIQET